MNYFFRHSADIFHLIQKKIEDDGEIEILLTDEKKYIFCDTRNSQELSYLTENNFLIIDTVQEKIKILHSHSPIYIDEHLISVHAYNFLKKSGIQFIHSEKNPYIHREQKTSQEIKKIQQSQRINESAFQKLKKNITPGVTEKQCAGYIRKYFLDLGAQGVSFEPIVAFGENGSNVHHSPTEKKYNGTDPILIDMGCFYEGYASDMTRMIFSENDTENKKYYTLLQEVTHACQKKIFPGISTREIYEYSRELLGEYGKFFTHGLGHGVGIEIHEPPFLSPKSDEILTPEMVITIEPGIYFPNGYGFRYENMIHVTNDGAQCLTSIK